MDKDQTALQKHPKFTVFYNIVNTPNSDWTGTGWEFFDDHEAALARYSHHNAVGNIPTMRPYHHGTDYQHLGATHRM